MALIRGPSGDVLVPARCLVGRSELANLRLSSHGASSEHALVRWKNGRWLLRDLASLNGTMLNGSELAPRETRPLSAGDQVAFGAEDERWVVVDVDAPEPCAVAADGITVTWGTRGLLTLPSDDAPEASVFFLTDSWVVDHNEVSRSVRSGEIVNLEHGSHRLILPDYVGSSTGTVEILPAAEEVKLTFFVSSDEERVALLLSIGRVQREFPPRACLYTLLTLARQRLGGEDGWLGANELVDKLKITAERLNVDIHRIRRLLHGAGITHVSDIVERHPTTRRLRVKTPLIQIKPL